MPALRPIPHTTHRACRRHLPGCGQIVDAGQAHAPHRRAADPDDDAAAPPVHWHLKLLLVALAIYLAYRLFQGVAWVVAHI